MKELSAFPLLSYDGCSGKAGITIQLTISFSWKLMLFHKGYHSTGSEKMSCHLPVSSRTSWRRMQRLPKCKGSAAQLHWQGVCSDPLLWHQNDCEWKAYCQAVNNWLSRGYSKILSLEQAVWSQRIPIKGTTPSLQMIWLDLTTLTQ